MCVLLLCPYVVYVVRHNAVICGSLCLIKKQGVFFPYFKCDADLIGGANPKVANIKSQTLKSVKSHVHSGA